MKFFIKFKVVSLVILALNFLPIDLVFAQKLDASGALGTAALGSEYVTSNDIAGTIALLIDVLIGLLGIIFLVLTIYSGYMWMTAAGDAKKVETAKSTLVRAVIGLVIILSAYAITNFVVDNLTRPNLPM